MTAAGATVKGLLAGLALAALAAAPVRAGPPEDLRLSYKVWVGGFNTLGLDARLRRTGAAYRIGLDGRTQGLVGWLFPYELRLEAVGHTRPERVVPRRFRQVYDDGGEERRREIRYRETGALELSLDGRATALEGDGLSDDLVRGALDPASAILALIETFARSERCVSALAVFDGKRRYDLALREEVQATLKPSRYALYSGPATLCRLAVEKRAGFRERGRFPSAFDVWLASPAAGAPALPVRIEGRSDLATMFVHLTAARTAEAAEQVRR